MPEVAKSIEINAPAETVYDLIAEQPERMPDWWTQFETQERVTPAPTVIGSRSQYVYNMMGIKIKGEHEVLQLTPNEHLYVKTLSGIDSAFEFTFEALDPEWTRLTVRVDYHLPGSILGRILDKLVIERENANNLQAALENLKNMLEQ